MDIEPSFELLRDFDALFRERHLTRAAARAGRSQPAMSRSLRQLREVFGDALFVRTSRGMIPTPRAEVLAPRVEALLTSARALVEKSSFDPRTLVRSFVIGASDLVDMQVFARLAAILAEEAPKVDLVSIAAVSATPDALADGRVDLWTGPEQSVPAGMKCQHLFDDAFLCAVRQDHPVLGKPKKSPSTRRSKRVQAAPDAPAVSLEAFVALSHIQIAPRGTPGGVVDTALAQLGRARRVAVRTTSFLGAPWLASRSDMVLTGPSRLIKALEAPFELATFAPPLAVPGFRIFQAWHPRAHEDPAHRWFRGLLRRVAALR